MKTDEISKNVKLFYEKYPFLFSNVKSKIDLYNQVGIFAKLLDKSIPLKKYILDLGCGTGQLASFLSIKKRNVVGIDFSKTSIRDANKLKKKLNLDSAIFMQKDLFNLNLPKESFDYTFCLGVLHHTSDTYKGFQIQCDLTKKGGFVVLGLYNTYGRLLFKLRRSLFKILKKGRDIDSFMRRKSKDEEKKKTWFMDQYKHPHESTHTIDEVLSWFKKNNIEFINSAPKFELFAGFPLEENLFKKYSNKNEYTRKLLHFLVQLEWIITRDRDGGFFIIIGKKK